MAANQRPIVCQLEEAGQQDPIVDNHLIEDESGDPEWLGAREKPDDPDAIQVVTDSSTTGHFVDLGQTYQAIRNHLSSVAKDWLPILGLTHDWEVSFHYEATPISGYESAMGVAYVAEEYQQASIHFCLPKILYTWEAGHLGKIEYVVVHELCHCLVKAMRKPGEDWEKGDIWREENVVTKLARSFLRARYHGRGERP